MKYGILKVKTISLLVCLAPDVFLGRGGGGEEAGSGEVAPVSRVGALLILSGSGGGRRDRPKTGEVLLRLPWDRVLVLINLHAAAAIIHIAVLTSLTRKPVQEQTPSQRWGQPFSPERRAPQQECCGALVDVRSFVVNVC